MPMIHPITGESISSYQRLMKGPATVETWMTAFRKDFGGMCQGDNKTGQKGTSAMFVMLHSNVPNIPKDRTTTYARVVADPCPQKEDPNCIQITNGGNLINYPRELTTRTTNIMTAKLLWNIQHDQYTGGSLLAPLDRYKYMPIPFALFPLGSSSNKH